MVNIGIIFVAIFSLINIIIGVLIKREGSKTNICPLDRGETIFKINEMHPAIQRMEDEMNKMIANLNRGVKVAENAIEYHNKLALALNNLVMYQKQLVENQKETNKILNAIKKNGTT